MNDKYEEIVVSKEELESSFEILFNDLQNYDELIEISYQKEDKNLLLEKLSSLLSEQHKTLEFGSVNIKAMELIGAYLKFSLKLLKKDKITFQVPKTSKDGLIRKSEFDEIYKEPEKLTIALQDIEKTVLQFIHFIPLFQKEKTLLLLKAITGFLKSVLRRDTNDMQTHIGHIHFLTSTKESYFLINEIGRIARDIYNNLQDFSSHLSLDEIEPAMMVDEMPDAIKKLNAVIQRTEEATNSTLDDIESLLTKNNEMQAATNDIIKNFENVENKLGAFSEQHPDLKGELDPLIESIKKDLHEKAVERLEQLKAEENIYIKIISNQSFQDLTGQTLKKIISFIETLELNLLELLSKYGGGLEPKVEKVDIPNTPPQEEKTEVGKTQSQNDVDQLLANFGF